MEREGCYCVNVERREQVAGHSIELARLAQGRDLASCTMVIFVG